MTGPEEKNQVDLADTRGSLQETGMKVGRALARSSFKVEGTGRRVRKAAGELVGTVARKKPASKGKSLFQPPAELTVEARLGFIAGDVYQFLQGAGPTSTEKLAKKLMQEGNTQAMVCAAIGWLAREGKITFSPDGGTLFLA
jgi:hypothetical protein